MSKKLYDVLDECVKQMLREHSQDSNVRLTLPALATRAGVSLSTVNRLEYKQIRENLKAGKPRKLSVTTNEDAAEWRRKYYSLERSSGEEKNKLKETIKQRDETINALIQKLQYEELVKEHFLK